MTGWALTECCDATGKEAASEVQCFTDGPFWSERPNLGCGPNICPTPFFSLVLLRSRPRHVSPTSLPEVTTMELRALYEAYQPRRWHCQRACHIDELAISCLTTKYLQLQITDLITTGKETVFLSQWRKFENQAQLHRTTATQAKQQNHGINSWNWAKTGFEWTLMKTQHTCCGQQKTAHWNHDCFGLIVQNKQTPETLHNCAGIDLAGGHCDSLHPSSCCLLPPLFWFHFLFVRFIVTFYISICVEFTFVVSFPMLTPDYCHPKTKESGPRYGKIWPKLTL